MKYWTPSEVPNILATSTLSQISIREDHVPYKGFTVCPLGSCEHNRLALELCNSPGAFERVMEDCFSDLNHRIMYINIDDKIIFSETSEEHLKRLSLVFQRLGDCGLKLSLQKCAFAQSQGVDLVPLDTLLPASPRPGSPPPVPVPRRPVKLKQLRAWYTSGEFSMSFNDKLSELNSLLDFDGVDKSIVTTAIVSLL
ncbi:hypothetical protein RRG08_013746 [Elysia crispata]|uniref:Reverse transcriptase domain-containing protein n=1 Tax=Elysia crispata TaxID=231223 RepID=A0AAE1DJM1_9GAST|nr:hypothetical protein RRG08_013746 [Elysia crispata]